ncbi:MAG: hypothetical protein J7485_11505 [Sphingobium sp.]|nr:hypothetical protein [Sphingobium sp.]
MKIILALSLALSSSIASAATPVRVSDKTAPPSAAAACDRECLRGKITEVLYALVEHDVSKLAVAPTLRVTEDAVEKPLDKVGLIRSVTKLRGYRQDILDERAGQGVASVMVEEAGAPIILVVRIKVDADQRISELELVTTRSRADGMIFAIDAYSGAAAKAMNIVPKPSQLAPRDKAIEIAMHYPRGLSNAKTFNAIGTPFAPEAYRLENGALMAGPGCTFAKGCEDIGNQSLAIFEQLGRVTVRDIIVDERAGIVIMRLSWNQRGPGSDKLTAWEMFKVYDGQIHMVQAYMRLFPPAQDLGGWPIAPGITQP